MDMNMIDKQPSSFSLDLKLEQLLQCNTRYDVPSFWGVTGHDETDGAAAAIASSSGVFDVLRHARNALEAGDGNVERPYKCDICSKRFAHPQTLDVHRRSHDPNEPTATSAAQACGVVLPDGLETKPSLDCLSAQAAAAARGQFSVGGVATMVFGAVQHRYNIAGVAALVANDQPRRYCIRATATLDSDAFARPCPVTGIITLAGNDGLDVHVPPPSDVKPRVRGSGERKFRCDVCSKMFRRNDHMIRHRRALHGPPQTTERVFQCDVCTKMFVRSDHLLRHRRTHRLSPTSAAATPAPTSTVWPQAPKVEFAYDVFGRMLHVGSGEYFSGFVPPAPHPVASAPAERKPRTMREKRFRCFICAKMFTRKDHLVRHRHLVHRLPQHIAADLSPGADCRSLPLNFPLPQAGTDLQQQQVPPTSSSGQHPDFPQLPTQEFRLSPAEVALNSTGGESETGVDRNSSQYACAACGLTYACAEHLRDHERRQHGGLQCNVGMLPYGTDRADATVARSDSARLRSCEVCGASFASDSDLREHMKRHGDSRATSASDNLPHQSSLGDHRHVDHNDRQCNAVVTCTGGLFDTTSVGQFSFDGSCNDVTLAHACDVCGRRFAHRSQLQAHAVVHASDRTFKCDVCENTFYQADKLRDHKARMHKIDT
jgi:stress-induced morphogen